MQPEDVSQRRFSTRFRGYDREEVTAFLRQVGLELHRWQQRVTELQGKLQAEPRGAAPRDRRFGPDAVGEEVGKLLGEAMATADRIIDIARQERDDVVTQIGGFLEGLDDVTRGLHDVQLAAWRARHRLERRPEDDPDPRAQRGPVGEEVAFTIIREQPSEDRP